MRQLNQFIRRVAQRGNDHHHMAALALLPDDPPGNVLDAFGISHRTAPVFLYNDLHKFPGLALSKFALIISKLCHSRMLLAGIYKIPDKTFRG